MAFYDYSVYYFIPKRNAVPLSLSLSLARSADRRFVYVRQIAGVLIVTKDALSVLQGCY